ncbi:MAG: bifunctional nuclease family protein [Bacteroidetes bacterium]|nr:bifunctional nuclease family protein [Bacteroidota bacterium]
MNKIKLDIIGISYSQSQSGAYALILGENEGKRRLPIIIGGFEAQSIAIELEKMKPSRPLTHDLFKNFAETFSILINEVIIYKFVEGVFYAKLVAFDGSKNSEIDARTSDAVAIAVRFDCPIYTYETILTAAGVLLDDDSAMELEKEDSVKEALEDETFSDYTHLSTEEINQLLLGAIDDEDYEKASKLRDELKKRK